MNKTRQVGRTKPNKNQNWTGNAKNKGAKYKRRPKKTENKPMELVEPHTVALERAGPDSQLEVLEPQVVLERAPQR